MKNKNEAGNTISFFQNAVSGRGFARRGQQALAGALVLCMLPLSTGAALAQQGPPPPPPDYDQQQQQDGYNQQQAPPPPDYGQQGYGPQDAQGGGQAYQPASPEQLGQLVAPIALYPDSLVAQVLAASTYPAQVASAEQFVQQSGGAPPQQLADMANTQPWDPSVKALVAFPQVLSDLNQNMSWTTQLGNVYYNQPQDVMNAVQEMRQRAYAVGSLRSNQQLAVTYDPGAIVIAPVNPAVVYVPYYNPWGVYGAPVVAYPAYRWGPPRGVAFGAGLAIGFGVGIAIGAFTHFSWGFHSWAPDWHSRTVVYNRNVYISRSTTVINRGHYGGFDRGPGARDFNRAQAARFGGYNNHTTINNVTVNRGGNTTINRGGNTFNNGNNFNRNGNNYNRGGNTFNNGNNFNRGGNTFNNGNNFNRGGNTQNNGAQFNRGGNTNFNGGNNHTTFQTPHNNGGQQQHGNPGGGEHESHGSGGGGGHEHGGGGGGHHH